MEQLRDIKPSVTIQIDLLPYLLGISLIILFIAFVLFFLMKKKKKPSLKQMAIKHLKTMDFETLEDKQIAYQFCEYGYMCVEEHYVDEFKKIERQLEPFKYKKKIPKLDNELKAQMKDYIKVRL